MELQAGDVLHCTSKGFLARAIQWFTKSRINHTALVIELQGKLFVIDSQRDGTNPRPLQEWMDKFNYEFCFHRPLNHDIEVIQVRALAKSGHTSYDFAALLWHQPVYILTGKWIGRRHTADKKMFCSEYVAWVYNFPNWHKLSPQALYEAMNDHEDFLLIF
jgi:hypothetical protein